MSIQPELVLAKALGLVRDDRSAGNVHPSMLQFHYLSGSKLTQESAEDLARIILTDEQRDPAEGHWGRNGNALADSNLRNVRCREATLAVIVPGTTWPITGHPDGLEFIRADGVRWDFTKHAADNGAGPWYCIVYENKAPLHAPGEDRVEEYYRQGRDYMAYLRAMTMSGVLTLRSAVYEDGGKTLYHVPPSWLPGWVIVTIQPYDSPEREAHFAVTEKLLTDTLTQRFEKAKQVIRAVLAGKPEMARDWDHVKDAGLGEFDYKAKVLPAVNDDGLLALVANREVNLKPLKDQVMQAWEDTNDAIKKSLLGQGLEKAKVGEYTVSITRVSGGIRHFVAPDTVSLRVAGGKKKVGVESTPVPAVMP